MFPFTLVSQAIYQVINEQLNHLTRDLWGQGGKGEQTAGWQVRGYCCCLKTSLFQSLIEALAPCLHTWHHTEDLNSSTIDMMLLSLSFFFFLSKSAIKQNDHNHRICSKERLVRKGENIHNANPGTTMPFLSKDKTTKLKRGKGEV